MIITSKTTTFHDVSQEVTATRIGWQLKVNVSELGINELILRVTGEMHIGGVIFELVEQLNTIKNDWSSFGLWWPEKKEWLTKSKMTLDQYGVQADAVLQFTRTHKQLRVQLPDQQVLDMNVDYSIPVFYSVKQICKDIGVRYSEEISLLKVQQHQHVESLNKPTKKAEIQKKVTQKDKLDSSSVSSSTASTLNNSLSNNSSSIRLRSSQSNNSSENLNYDPQGLTLSPSVHVHNFLTKFSPKYKNNFDKTRINSRWLDSSKSLMEQLIQENDLVLLRFKYFAFHELNAKLDPIRINQIYEQAKWSILTDEIDCTEQELINFSALQLQIQLQSKNYLKGLTTNYLTTQQSEEPTTTYIINETSAIYEDDDVDTALSKLEQSLDVAQISVETKTLVEVSKPINKGDFKLELAEDLFLMKPQKLTFKKFKSFFFVLDSSFYLGYFKSKDDSKTGRPIDKICLKGCELTPDVNISNRKFGINLKVPSMDGMSEMTLRCPNEESYARWLSACKLASRNKTISEQAFANEISSILNLLTIQQSNLHGVDIPDSIVNKTMSLSSNSKSIDSRTGHLDSDSTQANNLLPLRISKKYKIKQVNYKFNLILI